MEALVADVNWIAVVVGAVAAYALGILWYSEALFLRKWRAGLGTPAVAERPMTGPMVAQAVGTALLAWTIGVTETTDSLALAVLVAVTIAAILKSSGLFTGKSTYAIMVESGYVLAMAAVMILAHAIL